MFFPVLTIISLIFLTGIFVAAEFAIVSASRTVIEKKASEGNPVAKIIYGIHNKHGEIERYIASAQVGITLASLALGMYGEHLVAAWIAHWLKNISGIPVWLTSHAIASGLAVGGLTYFHIVLGEIVPKSLALQSPEITSIITTPVVILIKYIFYPLVVLMDYLGSACLRLMGVDRRVGGGHSHYHTPEELELIVQESQDGGLLREESGQVLKELIYFDQLTAGEIMIPRVKVTGIPISATGEEVMEILSSELHTRYPLYDDNLDHIKGIIHIKDLLSQLSEDRPITLEKKYEVPFVPETATLDKVLESMREKKTHMAVVMDEYGGTAGLVTVEDIFEEVCGEFDDGVPGYKPVYRDENGFLHIVGTVRVEEAGEILEIDLEHEEVDTVSGLVLSLLGRPPKVGDVVVYRGIKFEVKAVEGHGVKECILKFCTTPLKKSKETVESEKRKGKGKG